MTDNISNLPPTLATSGSTPRATSAQRVLLMIPQLLAQGRGRVAQGSERVGVGRGRDPNVREEEAKGLVQALFLEVCAVHHIRLRTPRAGTLIGVGHMATIAEAVAKQDIALVVVDSPLSAIQQRNLEKALKAKVIDRTGLILEIFGARAKTSEGCLQVELAHLDYQAGRLVRSWTHLERQRGGFGFLGGPGETQIEADRRMIRQRMAHIRRRLDESRRTRGLHRLRRQRAPWPVVALVGYTNAGKSTLFNRLTQSKVLATNMLFATLDPTMRTIDLAQGSKVILSDTVGFVSDLPTELIAAFRATLEEVVTADLIIHVRDISHADSEAQYRDVCQILAELGTDINEDESAESEESTESAIARPTPRLELWNKIDRVDAEHRQFLENRAKLRDDVALISATSGAGLEQAKALILRKLTAHYSAGDVHLQCSQGDALAWLHAQGQVADIRYSDSGQHICVHVRMSHSDWQRFRKRWASVAVSGGGVGVP